MTIKALHIPDSGASETARLIYIEPNLATMQKLVGGYIEAIDDEAWHAYINEDGKIRGLQRNPNADLLVRKLGGPLADWDFIVGPAVFLGSDSAGSVKVPQFVVDTAVQLGILPNPENPAGEDKPHGWRVTFDRIGRHNVDPLDLPAGLEADQIAEAVFHYARPSLLSRNVNVDVDLEARKGHIFCGFHLGGTFTLEPTTEGG